MNKFCLPFFFCNLSDEQKIVRFLIFIDGWKVSKLDLDLIEIVYISKRKYAWNFNRHR